MKFKVLIRHCILLGSVRRPGPNCGLYAQRRKFFIQGKPAKTSFATYFPSRFAGKTGFYSALDKERPNFLGATKSGMVEALGNKGRQTAPSIHQKEAKRFG